MDTQTFPAWHNGEFCSDKDLKISASDLGIMHGEGLYDVFTVQRGKILGLKHHLARFFAGCEYQQLKVPIDQDQLTQIVAELYQRSGLDQCQIFVVVTRGVPKTYIIKDILNTVPEVMIFVSPYRLLNGGYPLRTCVSQEVRRIPDWAVDQRHKNFARQDFNRAAIECFQRGFQKPLLLDEHGNVSEGPHFNVAVVKDNEVLSPAKNRLSGVTMKVIQELCADNGIVFKFTNISHSELLQADDVFATCTLGGILSIATVDDRNYQESNLQKRLKELYRGAWDIEKFTEKLQGY